jgi:hypothetical protein
MILVGDIILLWKIFLPQTGRVGLAMIMGLILLLSGTLFTIAVGQINFLVLFLLLLFWRQRRQTWGGVWLAMGMLIKPVLLFVFIYPLVKRLWRVLVGAAVALAVTSIFTITIFGQEMFFSYILANPIAYHMPSYLYTESVNQSLLATILRLTNYNFGQTSPLIQPLFLTLAFGLTGLTIWLVWRLPETGTDSALALVVTLALLIFPKTLVHYNVLLIAPLLSVWADRGKVWPGIWIVTVFISLIYGLAAFRDYVFWAIAMSWFGVAMMVAHRLSFYPRQYQRGK